MTWMAGGTKGILAWNVCPAELTFVGENPDQVVDYPTP